AAIVSRAGARKRNNDALPREGQQCVPGPDRRVEAQEAGPGPHPPAPGPVLQPEPPLWRLFHFRSPTALWARTPCCYAIPTPKTISEGALPRPSPSPEGGLLRW